VPHICLTLADVGLLT